MIIQELINGSIDHWPKRLLLVIDSRGGHVDYHVLVYYLGCQTQHFR